MEGCSTASLLHAVEQELEQALANQLALKLLPCGPKLLHRGDFSACDSHFLFSPFLTARLENLRSRLTRPYRTSNIFFFSPAVTWQHDQYDFVVLDATTTES